MIYLTKYTHLGKAHGKYLFDPSTGTYTLEECSSFPEATKGSAGFADERNIGFLNKRKMFVAFFLDKEILVLRLDKDIFTWPGDFTVKRRSLFPGLKGFYVYKGKHPCLILRYLFLYNLDFPGPLAEDIFMYIVKSLSSQKEMLKTRLWFQAQIAEENTYSKEFLQRVETQLNNL